MSWSTYIVGLPDQIEDRVNALEPPGGPFPPRDDQVKAAKKAAISLVRSGAVGDGEAFQVTLSGHANDDHKPQQGYGNDQVTIAVAQVTATAVATFDQQQEAYQKNLE